MREASVYPHISTSGRQTVSLRIVAAHRESGRETANSRSKTV